MSSPNINLKRYLWRYKLEVLSVASTGNGLIKYRQVEDGVR